MQEKEIVHLCKLGSELAEHDSQQADINKKIKKAQENVREYTKALCSHDLEKLFKAQEKAQVDNAFDFEPYVKAILDIDWRIQKPSATPTFLHSTAAAPAAASTATATAFFSAAGNNPHPRPGDTSDTATVPLPIIPN